MGRSKKERPSGRECPSVLHSVPMPPLIPDTGFNTSGIIQLLPHVHADGLPWLTYSPGIDEWSHCRGNSPVLRNCDSPETKRCRRINREPKYRLKKFICLCSTDIQKLDDGSLFGGQTACSFVRDLMKLHVPSTTQNITRSAAIRGVRFALMPDVGISLLIQSKRTVRDVAA
jgi:hypothetical protein